MIDILLIREKIKNIYQKYQMYINPILKFIVAIIVFTCINQSIGYNEKLKEMIVVILLSTFSAFMPISILVLLAGVVTILHIYFASKILAAMVLVIFLILYLLFLNFTPKQGIVVLAVPILCMLKIPYIVPILLGIIATPVSILPTTCGIIIYFLIGVIKNTAITVNGGLEDSLKLYVTAINQLLANKQLLLNIVIFAIIIIITYLICKLSVDHAFEIAIAVGGVLNIVLFLIGDLIFEIKESIIYVIVGTIISLVIVYIYQFFHLILDYSAVEKVSFEDDDYYYYVKAVPKMSVTNPEKNVKKINRHNNDKDVRRKKDTDEWKQFDEEDE